MYYATAAIPPLVVTSSVANVYGSKVYPRRSWSTSGLGLAGDAIEETFAF